MEEAAGRHGERSGWRSQVRRAGPERAEWYAGPGANSSRLDLSSEGVGEEVKAKEHAQAGMEPRLGIGTLEGSTIRCFSNIETAVKCFLQRTFVKTSPKVYKRVIRGFDSGILVAVNHVFKRLALEIGAVSQIPVTGYDSRHPGSPENSQTVDKPSRLWLFHEAEGRGIAIWANCRLTT
jgi:hypothetical protein